jgi:hypothetical protein
MAELDTWLAGEKTDPMLQLAIVGRLRAWLESEAHQPDINVRYSPLVDALLAQDAAGWHLPFSGMWLDLWSPIQDSYYRSIGSCKTGKKWLERLTVKIWHIAWQLWSQRNDWLHRPPNGLNI